MIVAPAARVDARAVERPSQPRTDRHGGGACQRAVQGEGAWGAERALPVGRGPGGMRTASRSAASGVRERVQIATPYQHVGQAVAAAA
jgi:hypothetical protein